MRFTAASATAWTQANGSFLIVTMCVCAWDESFYTFDRSGRFFSWHSNRMRSEYTDGGIAPIIGRRLRFSSACCFEILVNFIRMWGPRCAWVHDTRHIFDLAPGHSLELCNTYQARSRLTLIISVLHAVAPPLWDTTRQAVSRADADWPTATILSSGPGDPTSLSTRIFQSSWLGDQRQAIHAQWHKHARCDCLPMLWQGFGFTAGNRCCNGSPSWASRQFRRVQACFEWHVLLWISIGCICTSCQKTNRFRILSAFSRADLMSSRETWNTTAEPQRAIDAINMSGKKTILRANCWSDVHVEKLHAAVARITFTSQNVKKLNITKHLFLLVDTTNKNVVWSNTHPELTHTVHQYVWPCRTLIWFYDALRFFPK